MRDVLDLNATIDEAARTGLLLEPIYLSWLRVSSSSIAHTDNTGSQDRDISTTVIRTFYRTFDQYIDALLQAFKAGNPPPIHAQAGRRALALAYGAIESFETGRRVRINEV